MMCKAQECVQVCGDLGRTLQMMQVSVLCISDAWKRASLYVHVFVW